MNPRVNYEMSEADLAMILEACKPTPAMWGSGGTPLFSTPQENANRAWAELGKRMGFDPMTVRPEGDNNRRFSAVPSETEAQRAAREKTERTAKAESDVVLLKQQLADTQNLLADAIKRLENLNQP